MNLPTLLRFIAGYLVGFSIFILAIPYGLYTVAHAFRGPGLLNYSLRLLSALPLGILGLIFVIWSNAALLFRGRGGPTDLFNVAISPRTKHLVVSGPYRFSRNPMVFGVYSCYLALAIYWNSLAALGLAAALFLLIVAYLKSTEEKRLQRDFGLEYEEYRQRVPMIIPWPFGGKK